MRWIYITPLDVQTCCSRLTNPDIGQVDEWNFFRLDVTKVSDSHLYMIFKGRKFSKIRETAYVVSAAPDGTYPQTRITMEFKSELLNIPYPMTPVTELDEFMKLALNASRIE